VSHLKQRKEPICLNCGAETVGRYCHVCGQENLEPKETVWHLIQHFFNDITHFDGKFFSTVKYLIRKPGFMSAEYMAGRRASYLNPIRMYVFTSAIFFILLFALRSPDDIVHVNETKEAKKGLAALEKEKKSLEKKEVSENDPDDKKALQGKIASLHTELAAIRKTYGDTTTRTFDKQDLTVMLLEAAGDSLKKEGEPAAAGIASAAKSLKSGDKDDEGSNFFGLHQGRFKSLGQYDSTQRALPDSLRDGWWKKQLMRKLVRADEEYHTDKKRYFEHFSENMLHSFPKILFFSLPFFALFLNILYFRHKQYYYVDHGIFSIHVYCATFILMMGVILLNRLQVFLDLKWFKAVADIAIILLCLYMLIYLYKAMRGFYRQGKGKTFLKYLILCLLSFILNSILLMIFLLISAISV